MDTPPTVQMQVLSAEIMERLSGEIQWRIRALEAEAEVKKLQAEIEELKKPKDSK